MDVRLLLRKAKKTDGYEKAKSLRSENQNGRKTTTTLTETKKKLKEKNKTGLCKCQEWYTASMVPIRTMKQLYKFGANGHGVFGDDCVRAKTGACCYAEI